MHQHSGLRRYARVIGAAAGAGVVASALTAVTIPAASAALPDPTVTNQGNPAVADALNGNTPSPDGGAYSVGYEVVPVGDYATNRAILITKSNADGTLDTTWGTDGRKTIDLVSSFHESLPTATGGAKEVATGATVDNQGRLLIVGQVEGSQAAAETAVDTDVFVARVHPNGNLDGSFGGGGWTRISLSDGYAPVGATTPAAVDAAGYDVHLRPNRKILIPAAIGTDSGGTRTARDAAAVQLTAGGKLDASFGDGGVASIPTPQGDNLRRGLLDDDGSFFTTAYANVGSNNQPFISKFTSSGEPDESWGDDGLATTYPGGNGGFAEAYGMRKGADGNYTVTGYGYRGGRTGDEALNSVDAIIFSLAPDGSLNRDWADRGFLNYHIGPNGNSSQDRHRDHLILPDGRIVGAGGSSGDGGKGLISVTSADGKSGEVITMELGGTDDHLWGLTTVGDGYTVIASGFGGGDSYVVSLDLSPVASETSLSPGSSSAAYGAANTATIGLSVDGAAAAGSVDVTVDGEALETVAVSDSGEATVDLPRTLAVGSHEVEATFAGGEGVAASSASATVEVTKAATGTTVKLPKKVKSSKKATATIKVTADGVPAGVSATGKVTVKSGSKTLATANLKASDKGTVKVKLPKLAVKTHTVKVTYAGNANLKKSSGTAKLKVVK